MANDDTANSPWPRRPTAPPNAPNVLLFLTDDVGFGACSTFGGPIPTPVLDNLAARGLRFTQFNTAAVCSPTRAALLTGRNPHNVNMGGLANRATGFDGYTSVIPKSAGTVAEILRRNGYSTGMFGKGHVTPEWEISHVGPFDRWPTGLGFDYFYGFLGYDTNMWAPTLVENTTFIEPPHGDPTYHFDRDLADRAIGWIRERRAVAPDKPFFAYYATGTAHSPHHAPSDWLAKFRGQFDGGWDEARIQTFERQKQQGILPPNASLTPRPDDLPSWNSLTDEQRLTGARFMEAYAAALSHADYHVGRIIDALDELGQLDNTFVIFIQGDNGGSAEGGMNGLLFEQSYANGFEEDRSYLLERIDDIGGPSLYNHYPAGWGWAMNTPFQYYKQIASHFGGTRNGVVMSWPSRIGDHGGIRPQFHFVSDIMPTVLEAAGVEAPTELDGMAQDDLDGVSMLYSLADMAAPSRRIRQVFECLENFGIYEDGWFAGSRPTDAPWVRLADRKGTQPEHRIWELYDLRNDFSQSQDLAASHPDKLSELQQLFWAEANTNNILPIHPPNRGRESRPTLGGHRNVFIYHGSMTRVSVDSAPNTVGRSFAIAAEIDIAEHGGNGVIVSQGGRFGGYAFYMRDGCLVFHYNAIDPRQYSVRTATPLSAGEHRVVATFLTDRKTPGSGGTVKLTVDGRAVAEGRVEHTLRDFMNTEGFNVGRETITAVSPGYTVEDSAFTGRVKKVTITLE